MMRTVSLTVDTESEQQFVEIYERLARQAAGFILDGIESRIHAYESPDEEPE